jgi:WD40 repeat protein
MNRFASPLAVRALPPVSIPLMIRLALYPAAMLLAATAFPGGDLLAQAKTAPNQIEEYQQRASRWDDETAQRFFGKGAWREGVAYLGRALRLDPRNAAAARHLWSAVVSGGGDCKTLPDLALRQEAKINAAVFSPDGRRILTASADKTARLWDATTGAPIGEPMRHEDEVVAAVFSPDGARIATASKDRTARLWDAATLKPVGEPMRHEHPLDRVAFNSTGTRIVTECVEAGVVRLWDGTTGAPVGEAMPHNGWDASELPTSRPATFSPDGELLTTIEGGSPRNWDTASGRISGKPLRLPPGVKRTVVVSPDRKRAVTISNGKAQVWSMTTGRLMWTLSMKNSFIEHAEFSPDGTRIVTLADRGSDAGQLWDAATGKRVGGVLACPENASSAADGYFEAIFSPDSEYVLLTAPEDYRVRAWDCKTGEPYDFQGYYTPYLEGGSNEVFFTADGMRIVTTGRENAVWVWDAESGKLIGQPFRHATRDGSVLESTAVSPDGTRILTVDEENTVRVWHVDAWGRPLGELLPQDVREALLDARSPSAKSLPQDADGVPPMLTGADLPPAFVEALSGYRFSDDGVLGELPESEWAALRGQLRGPEPMGSAWGPLIGWWLASPVERPLWPGATLTRRERADQQLAVGLEADKLPIITQNAYLIDPTHPLIHIALAGLSGLSYGKRADFLRAYGIARLPGDPAIRARAAKMLIEQKQPELARKVTGANPAK